MTTDQKNQLKRILKDPVAEYTRHFANNSEQQIDDLKELCALHHKQKKQFKEIQDQGHHISRKIGEAKREGMPIADLKTLMQKQSAQAKAVTKQLHNLEARILAFFKLEDDKEETEKTTIPKLGERSYPGSAESSNDVSISLLSSELKDWNSYVESNPATSIYHRAEWRQLIRDTFGHEGHYFMARDKGDNVVGILPLIRLKCRLFGDFLVSMPYFNYGGAIADHPLIEQKLMAAADGHAASLGVSHIEYRDDIPRKGLPVRTEKVNMILRLPKNQDELWNGFTPKLRAQIKRPQRENPQVSHGGNELLDDFYQVFSRNMRDLGTPVYGKAFFRNILNYFPEQSSIMILRMENRPVAAAFLLGHKDTLEIPWASTIREVNHYSMNMLLYWEVLCFAIKEKYNYFDFGRSSKESGTYRFKQQWGTEPKPLYWHYWLNNNSELPSLNPSNPKYALMINIWKRLPIPLTKLIGPIIVKNLP